MVAIAACYVYRQQVRNTCIDAADFINERKEIYVEEKMVSPRNVRNIVCFELRN